jgi:hypothetical protein
MSFDPSLLMMLLGRRHWLPGELRDAQGGTTRYFYDDEVILIIASVVVILVTWFLVSRYRRTRTLRRRPRGANQKLLKQVVRTKSELSSQYLRPGFSARIHAVGIGLLTGGQYCIQVFINDGNEELWSGAGAAALPADYRGVPIVPIETPAASFLTGNQYPNGIRERRDVIIGGISGANTNLTGQSGTIGYFCTRKSMFPGRKEVHLLSNSHVFADLQKAKVDEHDLIMQPSPGEPASNRPIGSLVNFSAMKFDDTTEPNHVDAAIAKLWTPERHEPVIPMIGAVAGYVAKKDVEIGEVARKFGRTTGYTEGRVFSIYLDIWIRYDRTGKAAYFENQFLIEPAVTDFPRFVSKGDSGSLVVDAAQHAFGLIFAGMSDATETINTKTAASTDPLADKPKRIEGYGVANPISEVLDRMKIDLVIGDKAGEGKKEKGRKKNQPEPKRLFAFSF